MQTKLTDLLTYLLVGIGLPLAFEPSLLGHWKIVVLVAASVIISLSHPSVGFTTSAEKAATDRNSIWGIVAALFFGMWASLADWAYWHPALHRWATHFTGGDSAACATADGGFSVWTGIGLGLMGSGLAFRIWSIQTLGRAFTSRVTIVEEHQLVTTGPYKWVRHPSYLGSFIYHVGVGVFLSSFLGAVVAAVGMAWAYRVRIETEEAILIKNFGKTWEGYAARTARMVPKIW